MSYLTKQQLIDRFDQAEVEELLDGLEESVADAKVAAALNEAEAMVNSYLSRRYTLPITPVAHVQRLTADIARFYLHDNFATQEVAARYDEAMKHLRDIATHKADLAGIDQTEQDGIDNADQTVRLSSTTTTDLGLECF